MSIRNIPVRTYPDEYWQLRRTRVNPHNIDDSYIMWTNDDVYNRSTPVSFPFVWIIIISIIICITVSQRGRLLY